MIWTSNEQLRVSKMTEVTSLVLPRIMAQLRRMAEDPELAAQDRWNIRIAICYLAGDREGAEQNLAASQMFGGA